MKRWSLNWLRYALPLLMLLTGILMPQAGRAETNQWSTVWPYGGYVRAVAVSPAVAADQTIFAGTGGAGLHRSTDMGATWLQVDASPNITSLALSPTFATDRTAFAGTFGNGLLKSSDGGTTWSAAGTGIGAPDIWCLALSSNYAVDQTLFAGTYLGVFKSSDGGATWTAVNNGITGLPPTFAKSTSALAVSPGYHLDQTVFAGTVSGVHKSSDGGATWTPHSTGIGLQAINALALSPNYLADQTLFAGTSNGVYKSSNGGATWSQLTGSLVSPEVRSLAISPGFSGDQTLYAGTAGGLLQSVNGGADWTPLNSGLGNLDLVSLVALPAAGPGQPVYAGTGNGVATMTATLPAPVYTSYPLTVSLTGSGSGYIGLSIGFTGISFASDHTGQYLQGEFITLTAHPDPASFFSGWIGCDAVSGNVCTLSMNGARTVTAQFGPPPQGGNGPLYAWGANWHGQLGDGTTAFRTVPVALGLPDLATIAAGMNYSLALDTAGQVWAWGSNLDGTLGNGTYDNSNLPLPITCKFTYIQCTCM